MATATSELPRKSKTITRTITQVEENDHGEDAAARRALYIEPDFWEVIANFMGKDGHMVRVYRADEEWRNASSPIDNKLTEPFDEQTIYAKWGGGRYNLWLYRGSQLVRPKFQLELDGIPRTSAPTQSPNGFGSDRYDQNASTLEMVLRELISELRASRGTNIQADVVKNALDLNKQALTGAAITLREMGSPIGGQQTDEDRFLDRLTKYRNLFAPAQAENPLMAMITTTVLPEMLKRVLTPGDPLESIKSVSSILEHVKAFGGQTTKADFGSTLMAQLPMLGEKVVSGIKEYRLATESQERMIRIQNHLPPTDARVINVDAQPAAAAAVAPTNQPPAPPAAPQQPETQIAQPGTMPWFLLNVERMILNPNITGADIYEFVASCHGSFLMADDVFAVLTKDKETVVLALRQWFTETFGGPENEHVKRIVADTQRLMSVIDEYMAAVEADRGETPAPPAKPN